MGSFSGRKLVEVIVLWLAGLYLTRESFGAFKQWQAAILPLYVLVAGAWDVAFLRRRRNKPTRFRLLAQWSVGAAFVLGVALAFAGGWLARWYRSPDLETLFRLGGIALACEAARRCARAALADKLDFGAIARWELIRSLLFGVQAVGVVLWVKFSEEAIADWDVAIRLVGAFLVAEAVEAFGLLFLQRRRSSYPGATLPGPHVELWRAFGGPLAARRLRAARRSEWRFCAIAGGDAFFNAVSVSLPIYFLGRHAGADWVTLYFYAFSLATLPLYAALEAAQRVLLPALAAVRPERLASRAMLVAEVLSLATLPLLIWLGVFAPDIFVALFGGSWDVETCRAAGMMTRLHLLFLVLAPATKVCDPLEAAVGKPGIGLAWNLATFCGRAVVLWVGLRQSGPMAAVALYCVFSMGMWALYQELIARMIRTPTRSWVWSWARFAWLWALLALAWWLAKRSFPHPGLLDMALWGAAGAAFYAALLALVHSDSFKVLVSLGGMRER